MVATTAGTPALTSAPATLDTASLVEETPVSHPLSTTSETLFSYSITANWSAATRCAVPPLVWKISSPAVASGRNTPWPLK